MIPSYIFLALLSMVLIGIYDFVYSKAVRKGIGFLLAAASIFFLSEFRLGLKAVHRDRTISIVWAIAAMVSVGLLNIVYKLGVSGGVAPAMFLHSQAVCFITVGFIYAGLTQGGPRFSRQGWAHGIVASFCLSTGLIALLAALKLGEASVVTPIGQLSFVVSALMVTLWLGERFTKRKVAGLLLAVATIVAFLPG